MPEGNVLRGCTPDIVVSEAGTEVAAQPGRMHHPSSLSHIAGLLQRGLLEHGIGGEGRQAVLGADVGEMAVGRQGSAFAGGMYGSACCENQHQTKSRRTGQYSPRSEFFLGMHDPRLPFH